MNLFSNILNLKAKGRKQFAVLIDPDKLNQKDLKTVCETAAISKVDYFFVGSSILTSGSLRQCIQTIKDTCSIPVVLFPGNTLQICDLADGILFLSLISGRNPDMLIGNHVISAPTIRQSGLEVIPTGYMLVEGGNTTSVQYMSNTTPIPADKNDIALCTALAGEMLGLKMIFMDAGSGAKQPVTPKMIETVSRTIKVPLIVGGGITTPEKAIAACEAGADMIVIGNSIEKDVTLIERMAEAIHSLPVNSSVSPRTLSTPLKYSTFVPMILFGQETSIIEIVGFIAGIAGVLLTMKESIWNFPVGLVNVIASLVLFYRSQLYSDTFQQAVYIVLLSYGWYKWAYGDAKKHELKVTTSSSQLLFTLFIIAVLCSASGGYLFGKYTNAAYSYWDATGTSLSLIAQWMIAKKKIENWLLWIVVNILYIGIYYFKHLHLYMVLYAAFLAMAVVGYYEWKKHLTKINP